MTLFASSQFEPLVEWQTRAHILRMAELGMTDTEISFLIGIDLSVLLALYAEDIKAAILKIKLAAFEALDSLVNAGKPSAVLFWLRHRFPKEKTSNESEVRRALPPSAFRVFNHLGEEIWPGKQMTTPNEGISK